MISKDSNKNIGSIEEDIKILNKFANMTFLYGNRVSLNKKNLLEVQKSIINILSDYTRQKQINEEHQKINGELREKVKKLEKENNTLKNFTSSIFNDNVEKEFIPKKNIENIIDKLNKESEKIDCSIDFDENNFLENRAKSDCLQMIAWFKGELQELLQESEDK